MKRLLTALAVLALSGCALVSPVKRPVMADIKISQLPLAGSIAGSDVFPLVHSGTTSSVSGASLANYVNSQLTYANLIGWLPTLVDGDCLSNHSGAFLWIGCGGISLSTANTWSALQTYTNSDLALLGSSTGYTIFTSDNLTGTVFTMHVPAANDTLADLTGAQTFSNKSIAASEVNSGILSCSQMPALTGTVTTSSGTCATSGGGGGGGSCTSQNAQTTSYTLVIGDATKCLYVNCASACTLTIPANSSVAFTVPTNIPVYVDPASAVVTLAITTDTLTLAPINATGSRTLTAGATIAISKYATTKWNVDGTGVT